MDEVVAGVHTWSVLSEERGMEFNGFAVETGRQTVLVDPPEPADGWAALEALAPFQGIYVSNRNHSRAAALFRERFGIPVSIHELDAEQAEVDADELLRGNELVADEIELVHVPGKSPGELAFFVPERNALIVGDAVIGVPAGELGTYPEQVIGDRAELQRSLRNLLDLDFDALLLCDGASFPQGGREALRRFVEQTES